MHGQFVWYELLTPDTDAAKKFYAATLGWTFEAMEQGEGATYWIAKVGDESVAGIYTIFSLGLQLAAPVMVFCFIFNIATGLVNRVMPQFQVFFVASPLLVLTSMSVFALSLGVIGMVFIDRYRDLLNVFV